MTPLTDARLASIRSDIEDGEFGKRDDSEQYEAAELLLGEVDRLRAALAEAERERLLLALGWAEDIGIHAPRMPLNEFLKARDTARRIVEAANGGCDGD